MYNQLLYYTHLCNSLNYNKQNSLEQRELLGDWINNISGYDYKTSIEEWYFQLITMIKNELPDYFVKTIIVYEDDLGGIKSIKYIYYDNIDNIIITQDIKNTNIIIRSE